ncbi:MAG: hypothetical protein IKP65_06720 [Alphaproteobacteria bacterium]|nr:hypothetical protein [Alphaproteobacteria bacterium]
MSFEEYKNKKSMVYIVMKEIMKDNSNEGTGEWFFDAVFMKKKSAEQYVDEYNKKVGSIRAKIIKTSYADDPNNPTFIRNKS